ncbi:MAG: methyltransferase domain-containing protein [Gracilimonas sp.]|uniref:methyltransferase domain-containing protein n=1 Tax=Gracilimonas sp. TaxID=1974203 RepID=UPI0019BD9C5B|nr:methyltransferase domain-containing protein [Gracilimonas sp.]MBD3617601.1 methyltransferase domain-containing protein [Gracilimonas sp.]
MFRFLTKRQPQLTEEMDREDCNQVLLNNTYRQFSVINRLLSQWKKVYKKELRPLMQEEKAYSLLDIGFGGGDVTVKLSEWAEQDGINLKITAIDIDRRALDYVQAEYPAKQIYWKYASSTDLVSEHKKFDFVISNHVLHHLHDNQVPLLLNEAKQLASRKVIFNDIERSSIGYVLFNLFSRLIFNNSFITKDGLTSIKRSFTFKELLAVSPSSWKVKSMFPFRLLLIHDKS